MTVDEIAFHVNEFKNRTLFMDFLPKIYIMINPKYYFRPNLQKKVFTESSIVHYKRL